MKGKNKFIYSLSILLLLLLGLVGTGLAQGSDPTDDEVNAIARQLYCPVCENIPLDACGTAACEQWRGIIKDKLAEGWTEDQIKTYFVEQYGDRVLAEPPRRGFNWLVYLIPILALAAGIVLLILGFRKWRQAGRDQRPDRKPVSTAKNAIADDDYIKKVEEELRERSESKK
jgi:cytochrome c-type biogenesis protein CcmH